jgi:methionyl-tRNA formyltransferase
MTKLSNPIVFFGSGPVAAASLQDLCQWTDVEAVITKPQPPHHKEPFPVLKVAAGRGLKTYTPEGKAALSELFQSASFASPLGVVIDYGFIINQDVINHFPLGIVNSHFSLLPEWRGADPITFALLSGQKQTGVSLMLITAGMDEGPLLAQATYNIPAGQTTPELTEDLIDLSNQTLRTILPEYLSGNLQVVEQMGEPSYSRKLTKADGDLDFRKPASQLEREIRAYAGWPKSRTALAGKEVVITRAHIADGSHEPGKAFVEQKELRIGTSEGDLVVDALKPAGEPEMPAQAFLAGYGKNL